MYSRSCPEHTREVYPSPRRHMVGPGPLPQPAHALSCGGSRTDRSRKLQMPFSGSPPPTRCLQRPGGCLRVNSQLFRNPCHLQAQMLTETSDMQSRVPLPSSSGLTARVSCPTPSPEHCSRPSFCVTPYKHHHAGRHCKQPRCDLLPSSQYFVCSCKPPDINQLIRKNDV